jgi:hypothetical protein
VTNPSLPSRVRSILLTILADSLVPKIVQWLVSSSAPFHTQANTSRHVDDSSLNDYGDLLSLGDQTAMMDTIQELLRACFSRFTARSSISSPGGMGDSVSSSRGHSGGASLSIHTHATLSRSKWLIARYAG